MAELAQALPWSWDERTLVTELKAGSEAAFDHVVTHYHGPVFNLALGIVGHRHDAADVTQEVFLKVFRGIHGFRGGSSLKTWLYRIAIREALNHQRWRHRHHREQFSLEDDTHAPSLGSRLENSDPSPFDETALREQQDLVRSALMQVPPPFRGAIILRDLEGLSYEEVAEVLEISVGTVKSRILRGRRALREILDLMLHPATGAKPRAHLQNRQNESPEAANPSTGISTRGWRPAGATGGNL
jgi:RNA polymerase sigma-70 factor (ECF subfamily)